MTASSLFAVLTGDIVASSALSHAELDLALQTLADFAGLDEPSAAGEVYFTRYRGDGWQLALTRPQHDLRVALILRAALGATLPGAATRIALARGPGELANGNLNAATGPAFTRSGRALDALAPPALMAHAAGGALAATVRLADHISQGWTQAQSRAILRMLEPKPPTRKAVAAVLGITPQAVGQALDAAGYDALKSALALYETEKDAS